MQPAWDQRTSWERRPSWARQPEEADEPSRLDRHYELDTPQAPTVAQRPSAGQRPSVRGTQQTGARQQATPMSYTEQAQQLWPDSQPVEDWPVQPSGRQGYRQAEQPNQWQDNQARQGQTRKSAQRVRVESEQEDIGTARPSVRKGTTSGSSRPRLAGGSSMPSFTSGVNDGYLPARGSAIGNAVRAVGDSAGALVRGRSPIAILCILAAAILLVWGLVHFFGSRGQEVYTPSTPSYQSNSIVNQAAAKPRTFEQDKIEPLAKAAEAHKQEVFEARLGEFLVAQREHSKNIDLSVRDQYFQLGTSFPNNFESNGEKIIYLTFDDGPSGVTQQVLDVLDRYDAKATFFVTDMMPEHQHLIGEAYRRGHTIGMHTSGHDYGYVYSSTENYFEDLAAISATVKKQIGYVPCFIRFPGGSSNTISASYTSGIMSTLSELVQYEGYQYYDWNCEDGDARGSLSTQEIIDIALQAEYETDSTNLIMLLHDANDKQTTVEALPTIIEHYMQKGYRFDAITPDSMVYHQQIAN